MADPTRLRVRYSPDGRRCRVELDRPPVNALDDTLIAELTELAAELRTAHDLRVVVLTAAAEVFMVGMDLSVMDGGWDRTGELIDSFQAAVNAWEALPVGTVAVLPGHALGAGCELALACDWRLMARGKARIGLPEARRGLIPAGGGTQRMARTVGSARALDLCLRGRMLDAAEAAAIGLVSQACEPGELARRTDELADELAGLPPLTVAAIKRCVRQGADGDLATGLAIEKAEMLAVSKTADAREGVRSFLERRDPVYRGE